MDGDSCVSKETAEGRYQLPLMEIPFDLLPEPMRSRRVSADYPYWPMFLDNPRTYMSCSDSHEHVHISCCRVTSLSR